MQARQRGITLIEIMVALAIVGILSAVALPSYRDYVTRGRLTEAFTTLAGLQPNAEQYWNNNRTFVGMDLAANNVMPGSTPNFTYALSNASPGSYTVTATGRNTVQNFVFTIDQQGNRATTQVPSGWTANATCWADRRSGTCTQ